VDIKLTPKQTVFFTTSATEILFGGAAGGAKSFALRVSAIRWCGEVSGVQVYLFRRTLPDLRDNHLRGPTSFFVMLAKGLESGQVKYKAVENEFEFQNGSVLHLCYCDSENDVEKYRGAEIHVLLIDELTHFSEYQYRFLRSRVRVAGVKVPQGYRGRLPRIEAASNPGSVGHAWVKRAFISPKPELEIWKTPSDEGGMLRQFIPAKLSENPYLSEEDPDYANRLRGLGAQDLVKAMLDGNWDIVAGMAFEKLRRDVHCVEPFTPPEDWLVFGSLDWGSTRPFSFGLWAVSNGNEVDGRTYQRGALIRYRERYGWNGKPNEGLRMEVAEVAQEILKVCDRKPAYIIADPSMWKVDGGPSHAETMMKSGVILRKADHNRHAGYLEVRQRIAGNDEGPLLYATKNCHDGFWRTMPDIVMDAHRYGLKSEDVDTNQEDHCFASGTLVLTIDGAKTIEDVVRNELILTTDGWSAALPIPPRIASCVQLTYDDGSVIVCTPDHKFLTLNGWKEAKDLLNEVGYNVLLQRRAQWLRSLAKPVKNLWACVTGSAAFISSARESGYIASYGNITEDQFKAGCMSTIRTQTERTMQSRIFSSSANPNISAITEKRAITPHGSSPCVKEPGSGTGARPVASGTPTMPRATSNGSTQRPSPSLVSNAERLSWLKRLSRLGRSFVTLIAKQKRCVSVEPAGSRLVYCLHVPIYNHFALCDGTIVSNCYDDVRYACMSRPWLRPEEKKAPAPDRWLNVVEDEEVDEWRIA